MTAGEHRLLSIGNKKEHSNRHVSFRIDPGEYQQRKRIEIHASNGRVVYESGEGNYSENTLNVKYHAYPQLIKTTNTKGTNQNDYSGYLTIMGCEKKYDIPKSMDFEKFMREEETELLKILTMYFTSDNNHQENDSVENLNNYDKNKKQLTGFFFKTDQLEASITAILQEKKHSTYSKISEQKIVLCVPIEDLNLRKIIYGGSWRKGKLISIWPIVEIVVVISVENDTEPYILTAYPRRAVQGLPNNLSKFMNSTESLNSLVSCASNLDGDEEQPLNFIYRRALDSLVYEHLRW